LRETIRSWRFYDHFRTDAVAPVRQPQIGTRTPVLGHEGTDLAAALQTILEIGDHEALQLAIEDAFPGARISVNSNNALFSLAWYQPGLLRPLAASELLDGTLRYLLLVAALLTPRPPALMILNEPETSLHPDLLPALARLIRTASRATQIIVVSHAAGLVNALELDEQCVIHNLHKENGATRITGMGLLDAPAWQWPSRS
jgi:predicted ATPase